MRYNNKTLVTMKRNLTLALLLAALIGGFSLNARENKGNGPMKKANQQNLTLATACDAGTGRSELNVNNVRTLIFTSGDMWWDLVGTPRYEIPKGSNKHSMFASALWIGGVDAAGGSLRVAAMTYRQTGNDFWPGPLDTTNATIEQTTCLAYDKLWKVSRAEVLEFINSPNCEATTPDIETWPGNGDQSLNQAQYLAPFEDLNNNGIYEFFNCEYPRYDLTNALATTPNCKEANYLFGDQTLFWIFNDKGNTHSETGGFPIGLEMHAQAFAFATNDELNNMTFYRYKIFNRSSAELADTYFGQWVDSDVGFYQDDYVGCDVARGLGYTYNGDADDQGIAGYGLNPPAAGLDFFQGPKADPNDGIDNDRDLTIDEAGEEIIMAKYVYYNNTSDPITGNPNGAQDVYNYLRGNWKNGTQIGYGGNGIGGQPCNFMFPGTSDQTFGWGTNGVIQPPWDEVSSGNTPDDRRFLISAGPFTLAPGAVNFVTVGAVWARASSGGPVASVNLLKLADDKAQTLFDNCFRLIEGPPSPEMKITELDKKLILELNNYQTTEGYNETVATSTATGQIQATYTFQGYQIYQLQNANVSQTDLDNPDLARLIFQVDVEDGITQIVNRYFDPVVSDYIPKEEVNGENKGIRHTFEVTRDAFATGNDLLVNHKTYHFIVVAYAFSPATGLLEPYIAGIKNFNGQGIPVNPGIPHINSPKEGGADLGADYAGGPKLTRIEGQGNGGQVLDLTPETIAAILTNGFVENPTYENARGPVNIKVVDPLRIKDDTYTLQLDSVPNVPTNGIIPTGAKWKIWNSGGDTIFSEQNISVSNEQILLFDKDGNNKITPEERWGFSVTWLQTLQAGDSTVATNGLLDATLEYQDVSRQWLGFMNDNDNCNDPRNWIRSGTQECADDPDYNDYPNEDNSGVYESVIGGGFAPYRMAADKIAVPGAPAWDKFRPQLATFNKLASVDIVITPDRSKWTRCPVVELCSDDALSQGNARKMDLRDAPSVDKDGKPTPSGVTTASTNPNDPNYMGARGLGWFPGYAINLETGERLPMMFGENSFLTQDNGADMRWNPTGRMFSENPFNAILGGMHWVYVMGRNALQNPIMPRYYEGNGTDLPAVTFMAQSLSNAPSEPTKRGVYKDAMWVGTTMGIEGKPFLSNDVTIRLRVRKPYAENLSTVGASNPVNNNINRYTFSTADIFARINNADAAKRALDIINVVPNPYYAFSAYERNQLDNRIKITNLPQRATIRIFTLNGTLVRTFKKDDPLTSLDWDLRNQAQIPIASGLYIIHVDVPGVGEKILKWFGVMRPIDLDTF